jgi:hypothetical protein
MILEEKGHLHFPIKYVHVFYMAEEQYFFSSCVITLLVE